jgi:tetratricopeptide (TPR) repeat protein
LGVPYFESALKREPNNFYALFGLADCYRGMRQQKISINYWNMILSVDSRNKVILTRAGDAYRNQNLFEKAQEYYERALNIEFDIYAVLGMALIAKAQDKFSDAIGSIKRLIQQYPDNSRLLVELADCYLQSGDKRTAAEIIGDCRKTELTHSGIAAMYQMN